MNCNEHTLFRFLKAFQHYDYKTMQTAYADTALFSDPVFPELNALQTRAMWEMLIKTGVDLWMEFNILEADDRRGAAEWTAYYTFSKTGRKVANPVHSVFEFAEGKIIRQVDCFDFRHWAAQALGAKGWLLGGTRYFQAQVQASAANSLQAFMHRAAIAGLNLHAH